MAVRWNIENCTDIDFEGNSVHEGVSKLFSCFEAEVAAVDIVGQGEGKLSVVEVTR